jgi:hypothetical protein
MDDFKLLLGTNESRLSPDNAERLANACLVVNALGPKVRAAGLGEGVRPRVPAVTLAQPQARRPTA